MYFGVDYYPEHWPPERWEKDAQMMKEAKFNTVRLGEFAWAELEPKEGSYNFNWLDEAIEILTEKEIQIVLGTPTAAPPPWLTEKHPEVLPVNKDGEVVGPGHRRHYCVNDKKYRDYTRKIVGKMAGKYGEDPRIIGWQIDNELGHPVCYCDTCKSKFLDWLRKKYEDLDELNNSWGTSFWSHTYTDWNQIPLPNENSRNSPNPSLHLDYKRFFSDSVIEYTKLQAELLKEKTSEQWICHNFMGFFGNFDHYGMCENLDIATWDNYPAVLRDSYKEVSAGHDLTYGFKEKPFWVMEEQCSYLTREKITAQPRPGETRMWTYQSLAHGANGIMYFRWRPCRFGDEQFHGGVLQHDGSRKSPSYQEIKEIGGEIEKIEGEIEKTEVDSDVAILHSYEQRWSMDTYRYHSPLDYRDEFMKYYSALFDHNLNTTFIPLDREFEKYDILITPVLPMVEEDLGEKLENFVEGGGTLISSYRTGIKDHSNVITNKTLPGGLTELFGLQIHSYTPIQEDQKITFEGRGKLDGVYRARKWADCLEPKSAETVAKYLSGWPGKEGYSAITRNEYGEGHAIYVGVGSDEEFYQDLIGWIIDLTPMKPVLKSDKDLEVVKRSSEKNPEEDLIFAVNHSGDPKTVQLDEEYMDILTEKKHNQEITLEPYGVVILKSWS